MDKPLKYFLMVSAVFLALIGTFAVATFTGKHPVPNEYAVIDEDDNLMIEAKRLAQSKLDTLFLLYPLHPDSAFVRFTFEPAKNHTEHLWGKITGLDSMRVKILLKRKAGSEDIFYPEELELKTERIEDWMVNIENGSVRGGYTVQVMLMKERENPRANADSLQAQLQKFRDTLD